VHDIPAAEVSGTNQLAPLPVSPRDGTVPIKKVAVGIFHFNLFYVAGDEAGYHRYCTEAVIPFLETIATADLRVTFEMSGSGLEFLDRHYASALDLLRTLMARGQVELISATYAPTVWVAFPQEDLLQSIDLNARVLGDLGLRTANIFFAQECFFGPGLERIAERFALAICSVEHFSYFHPQRPPAPLYTLGKMRVLVGGNHLLNDLASRHGGWREEMSAQHQARLTKARRTLAPASHVRSAGKLGEVEYYWYHLGSGHHFTTAAQPTDWDHFFCDPEWIHVNLRLLGELQQQGYTLSHLEEFAGLLASEPTETMPFVTESSWNSARSHTVYAWMGSQLQPWHQPSTLLGAAWRSRREVKRCATLAERRRSAGQTAPSEEEIALLWRLQIIAECSDPLGWSPTHKEVQFGREATDSAYRAARSLRVAHGDYDLKDPLASLARLEERQTLSVAAAHVPFEFLGANGTSTLKKIRESLQLLDVTFTCEGQDSGVRFERTSPLITYCPSGMEDTLVPVAVDSLAMAVLFLPLANGLISVGRDLHIIRVNASGQMAVRLTKSAPDCVFALRGVPAGRPFRWRFLLHRGADSEAIEIANTINGIA
jgi:hypothetical protein